MLLTLCIWILVILTRGKTVCELGGGYSGLAGLAISIGGDDNSITIEKLIMGVGKVLVTDGNDVSAKSIDGM